MPGIGGTNGAEPVASTQARRRSAPAGRGRRAGRGVEGDDGVAEHQLDTRRVVEVGRAERQVVGGRAVEQRREVHPVVGPPALLADDDERAEPALDGGLDEAVADHAVADDEDRVDRSTRSDPYQPAGRRAQVDGHVTARQTT